MTCPKVAKIGTREREPLMAVIGETNEVERYEPLKKRKLGAHWVATFQDGCDWLARQDVTGEQLRVFLFLLGRLDYDNWLRIKSADICEALAMRKQNVSRAIARLVDMDVIARGPLAGRCNTYRLNPRIAHKGAKHFARNIVQYEELRKRKEARDGRQAGDGGQDIRHQA